MRVLVDGHMVDPWKAPTLRAVRAVKEQLGLDYLEVRRYIDEDVNDGDQLSDLITDPRFIGWLFLARVTAGEHDLTGDEMLEVSLDDIAFITETRDQPAATEDTDPTEPVDPTPASARAGSAPAGAAPSRTSRSHKGGSRNRSKKRSSRGSR